jgi:hypothetical protein
MAKSYHLKKIIDSEIGHTGARLLGNHRRNEDEARPSQHLSVDKFIDELTLWKAALQIEKPGID